MSLDNYVLAAVALCTFCFNEKTEFYCFLFGSSDYFMLFYQQVSFALPQSVSMIRIVFRLSTQTVALYAHNAEVSKTKPD